MDKLKVFSVNNVLLARRGHYIVGSLLLSKHHLVFTFRPDPSLEQQRDIWICYPIIEKVTKSRGPSWTGITSSSPSGAELPVPAPPDLDNFDKYLASHIRIFCKDFTYYSFDFPNETMCADVFGKLSKLSMSAKVSGLKKELYAYEYRPNVMETKLDDQGWDLYNAVLEFRRQDLLSSNDCREGMWRLSDINIDYKLCPSYPRHLLVPSSVSDSVLQHASKFRLKQRIPAVVYKHRGSENGNVIARCAQPLVGLNFQTRSLQDEKLVEEIFRSQEREKKLQLKDGSMFVEQPQRNLIVDLRPITNAMAQHALGAGTENVENYKAKRSEDELADGRLKATQTVDKIFCNIDNIHVMRDSLNKLVSILSNLDRYPIVADGSGKCPYPLLQQALTKTQWLHRLSIILQSVDRITKSVHLNNTNVLIHCSDGWDRTSQVSALLQLCLDPYYRTMKGFMVLVEKEWVSFGFKFSTRADHGACIGATLPPKDDQSSEANSENEDFGTANLSTNTRYGNSSSGVSRASVAAFLLKAASHIKNTASAAASSASERDSQNTADGVSRQIYNGSSERSPIFHQFLDCVYQVLRQYPDQFEFNSRFLKRLFYHHYSCQYGTFLCDSELEMSQLYHMKNSTVSVWDYFLSRPSEFVNPKYSTGNDDGVLFFNYSEVKWWYELYGRSDEEMNGLSNSLDRKFAQLRLGSTQSSSESSSTTLA